MTRKLVELTLPETLGRELEIVPETGLYSSESEFIVDGIRTLLCARRDVRIALACRMYEKGEASLSGAASIAEVDLETMKTSLADRGITRFSDATIEEMESMARSSARAAGRA